MVLPAIEHVHQKILLVTHQMYLLLDTLRKDHLLILSQELSLVAWMVSRDVCQQQKFQRRLQILSQISEEEAQFPLTSRSLVSGLAGVVNGKFIPVVVM